jgi:hypothetical protein
MDLTKIAPLLALPMLLTAGCYVGPDPYYPDPNPYPTPTPGPSSQFISQYGDYATASSDGMPGSSDFSAMQATGAPDVAVCGDDPRAWSPSNAEPSPGVSPSGDTVDDYLEVSFPAFVWVSQVAIYESYNPGGIVEVDLEASDDSTQPMVLWQNYQGDGYAPCPSAFVIDVDQGTTYDQYDRVLIWLDSNLTWDANHDGTPVNDYNEIDAVQLSGDELVY